MQQNAKVIQIYSMSKVTIGECISPELSNEMQNLRGGKEIVFYQKESCVKGGKTTNITHTKGRLHKKNLCYLP